MSLRKSPRRTPASVEARQLNSLKSTGPRTESGKDRAKFNSRYPVRLLGLAEARVLNQDVGAAERLFHDLIAPYPNAPPVLVMHFEDLARRHLELEAWERIRDAQLEQRWVQNHLMRRRLFLEMERDLEGTTKQFLEEGIYTLPDSPAKFRKLANCLELLQAHLRGADFQMEPVLHYLYGKDLDATHDRAHTICIRCRKLIEAKPGEQPLGGPEFEELLDLVAAEEKDALTAYGLALDEKTMTRAACQARLGPTREDVWMDRRGEQLRIAIDRKQRVITELLKALGLIEGPARKGKQ